MCQMTWVRLQHCRFTRVNGGGSAKVQVRGRSRRFALLPPSAWSQRTCPPTTRRRRVPPSAPVALLLAPDSTCAPYEGRPVDRKGNKGVNSGWTNGAAVHTAVGYLGATSTGIPLRTALPDNASNRPSSASRLLLTPAAVVAATD